MSDTERLDLISEALVIIVLEQAAGCTKGNRFRRLEVIASRLGADMCSRGHGGQLEWILSNLTPTRGRLDYDYGGSAFW